MLGVSGRGELRRKVYAKGHLCAGASLCRPTGGAHSACSDGGCAHPKLPGKGSKLVPRVAVRRGLHAQKLLVAAEYGSVLVGPSSNLRRGREGRKGCV